MRLVCRGLSPRAGDTISAFSLSLLYYPLRHVEGLESRYVLRLPWVPADVGERRGIGHQKGLVLSRDCPNPLKSHTHSFLLC